MNKENAAFIAQWMAKADEDLLVVEKLVESGVANTSACFHCQQAAEKFLKAFLISNGIEIRKTHNIEFLLAECADLDPDFLSIEPKELSDFGVEARYPGDFYIPSPEETLEYRTIALEIKRLVEVKINKFR